MRVVVVTLISMAVSASAFGVARSPVKSTALAGLPETITAEVQEKEDKAERWRAIRHLSDEEAKAQLSGEELESYNNYHASVKQDIERAVEVATLMLKDLEPERIKPKSKKQVKRDKWAKVSAIAAARAAAK